MLTEKQKIKDFTDLIAWQESHKLVLLVYRLLNSLPNEEKFALTDQMRRAAVSITSNIAEGFSRQTVKEKVQFYFIAQGSLSEIQNQTLIALDLGYINKELKERIFEQSVLAQKLIYGMIRSLR